MSDSCCGPPIDTRVLQARERRVLMIVLVINAATFVMMAAASLLSGSSTLLSGALDNFGDTVTYALSFVVVGASTAAKARVALVKGLLIAAASLAVAIQILWRLLNPESPIIVETMSYAAVLNLGANIVCLRLLTPYRNGDVNLSSAWECSRNDVFEGTGVIATAIAIWVFDSSWPDIVVAIVLLALFSRSAARVLGAAGRDLRAAGALR